MSTSNDNKQEDDKNVKNMMLSESDSDENMEYHDVRDVCGQDENVEQNEILEGDECEGEPIQLEAVEEDYIGKIQRKNDLLVIDEMELNSMRCGQTFIMGMLIAYFVSMTIINYNKIFQ